VDQDILFCGWDACFSQRVIKCTVTTERVGSSRAYADLLRGRSNAWKVSGLWTDGIIDFPLPSVFGCLDPLRARRTHAHTHARARAHARARTRAAVVWLCLDIWLPSIRFGVVVSPSSDRWTSWLCEEAVCMGSLKPASSGRERGTQRTGWWNLVNKVSYLLCIVVGVV
jgi:hypothetical protein